MSQFKSIGRYFLKARKSAGFTQEEVAEKMGYSSGQFVSNWERGMCRIPMEHLPRLIGLYKLKPNKVIEVILEFERRRLQSYLKSRR